MTNTSTKLLRNREISNFSSISLLSVLAVLSFITVYPVILTLTGSFTEESALAKNGYQIFAERWSSHAYQFLWESSGMQIARSYIVTIAVTAIGTLLAVLTTLLCSYALTQVSFAWRNHIMFIIFFTMLFNVGLVPSYVFMVQLYHLKNTIWALILPLLINPFNIIVLRTFISMSVHTSLIESAKLDGANHYVILYRIVMPLSKAGTATIGFFFMLAYWNDWFNAMLYIDDIKLVPVQGLLQRIQSSILYLSQNAGNISGNVEMPSTTLQLALNVIATLPILCAYPFFQKYFIQGLTVGAVKS